MSSSQALPTAQRSQRTLLATWLTQLYIAQLGGDQRAAAAAGGPDARTPARAADADVRGDGDGEAAVAAEAQQLRDFLNEWKEVVDAATTERLLGDAGLTAELLFFAALRGDFAAAVRHHLQVRVGVCVCVCVCQLSLLHQRPKSPSAGYCDVLSTTGRRTTEGAGGAATAVHRTRADDPVRP